MNDDLVEDVAWALHAATCPMEQHIGHVTSSDRLHAHRAIEALVPMVRHLAERWQAPTVMDVAAWMEGTL